MGVNGLWTVVQPCARPTNLATLNRKRLAVDASIWIYQFLKAVRDKEGNALRNSHVVGFFRRICKLLWFGIKPVFVFDGGAPALKRATLQGRRRRREGRREDAARTAGKLLAVQMQRMAEEEDASRKRKVAAAASAAAAEASTSGGGTRPRDQDEEEPLPDADKLVYVDEIGMSNQERQRGRQFRKQDQYHLPELDGGIESMGRPDDPRIMSVEELEEYARQFHSGEDLNLYDFSKIDFNGDFFKSLPPADRYNILNAARIRSRLRMGLSKDQLDDMFPDRMAFSRFQIERVKERNHLTQRLMFELGMNGTDLTVGSGRVAGERNREYILVKNDGVEGGYALGVVSKDKDEGKVHKPIDVDALDFQYQAKQEDDEWEDEEDFEDVPIEGLNRLPKIKAPRQVAATEGQEDDEEMFVGGDVDLFADNEQDLDADEDEDINRAIAMSLQNQHGVGSKQDEEEAEEEEFEDVPAPQWHQKAVEAPRPIARTSGRMVAHIVNNRANASVVRRRESNSSSDSEMDLGAAVASARRAKPASKPAPKPVPKPVEKAPIRPNVKNPFDGPLPFEKLSLSSIFSKKPAAKPASKTKETEEADRMETGDLEADSEDEGGFEKEPKEKDKNAPRPLPPWLADNTDIRESLQKQQERNEEMAAETETLEHEERELARRRREKEVVTIDSDNDESDIEIIDAPPVKARAPVEVLIGTRDQDDTQSRDESEAARDGGAVTIEEASEIPSHVDEPSVVERAPSATLAEPRATSRSSSPEMEFEDVEVPDQPQPSAQMDLAAQQAEAERQLDAELFEDATPPPAQQQRIEGFVAATSGVDPDLDPHAPALEEFDDFSDPEEEELLAQMAEEAEEHARFAGQLNNRSERESQDAYERELKVLRNQQKKDRRDADEVTQVMVTECQSLLRLFGIPYITAPMEAEAQCAELVHLGLVDGIVTDDSDTFLFGGTRVYKNMFNGNKFVECYLGSDLEKELSLSREQLIALAQLLGSDYTEGLPGVGPVTAVEILSEFPGGDGLAEFKEWWQDVQSHGRPKEADAASPFRRKFRKSQAAKLFLPPGFPSPAVREAYLRPEVDDSPETFQWGVPDLEGLRDFLMATIGWSQERTDEVLVPVIKDMNRRGAEGTQTNITRYFEGGVGVGARPGGPGSSGGAAGGNAGEAFAPRQRLGTSRRMADAVNKLRAKSGAAFPVAAVDDSSTPKRGKGAGGSRKRKATGSTAAAPPLEDLQEEDGTAAGPGGGVQAEDHVNEETGSGIPDGSGRARAKGKRAKAST